MSVQLHLELGSHAHNVAERLAAWDAAEFSKRLWERDHTIWFDEPQPELTDRLGWLSLPNDMAAKVDELEAFATDVKADGIRHVVVLGMGGSSLAPEVYQATFGNADGFPALRVLDSTHPAAVLATAQAIEPLETVFIVASKSGTTLETLSFFRYFWHEVSRLTERPGDHFIAITDPGTPLEQLAEDRAFRRTFTTPPDVGGRYSALTYFGLVPAALIGVDVRALLAGAQRSVSLSGPDADEQHNPGLRLGAALGELALAGCDKVTLVTDQRLAAFPVWIEQLIAESTGKAKRGIVPIGGEPVGPADVYGSDRVFLAIDTDGSAAAAIAHLAEAGHPTIHILLDDVLDMGGAMFLLSVAVASSGAVLGINPFNQPDVQLAKQLAKEAMEGKLDVSNVEEIDAMGDGLAPALAEWIGTVESGDYVGIHAFLAPTEDSRETLAKARLAVRDAYRVATTFDFGPRFLHSTGQLYKGGPNTGLFLQIIDHPAPHLPVPETDYDFGKLVSAQALGDHLALRQRGRRVMLVCLGDDGMAALQRVAETLASVATG